MLRAALVSLLQARRNNDVYVLVPVEGEPPAYLAVEGVVYDPTSDMVLIRTEPWWATPATDDELRDAKPLVSREYEGWPAGRAARGESGPAALPPQSTPVAEHGDDLREPDGNAGRPATGGNAPRPEFAAMVDRIADRARQAGVEVTVTWQSAGQATLSTRAPVEQTPGSEA